jgi:transposase
MWTEITRAKYERAGRRYASDPTDAEWRLIEPFMPSVKRLGRPRETDLRAVVDAILYIARTGCQWRLLPKDFPPFTRHHDRFPWLRHLFADSVYNGPNLRQALAKFGDWTIESVTRAAGVTGFQLLPRRWVVERTLAWLNRNRRLAKDFETSITSATTWIYIASTQLLIRRLVDG